MRHMLSPALDDQPEMCSSPVREWKKWEKPERYLDMGIECQNNRKHEGVDDVWQEGR